MNTFTTQCEAIGTALLLINKLPPRTVWALHCTNDDDETNPAVLNIWCESDFALDRMAMMLRLREAEDIEDAYHIYKLDALYVSLITDEENLHGQR